MTQATEIAPLHSSPLPPVEKRDIEFDLSQVDLRRWQGGSLHITHQMNALSIFFPEGEKMFIESVRYYRSRIADPRLAADVQGFIGQEAMHGREHRAYNEALEKAGYPIPQMEQTVLNRIGLARKVFSPRGMLAVTIALEHLTAILANVLLKDARVLAPADPRMAALWRWHAIEETEHKAVAFDVYRAVSPKRFRAYLLRCSVLITATINFFIEAAMFHFRLVKADGGARDWKGWRGYFRWLLVSPGILRQIIPAWLSYFRPGFHPWQHDNRAHVERWKAAYAASGTPP